ncbi:YdiK family protein [Alkalibacillus salilacus]|uniref:DUF4305 domain-containing protein n=1 Tax=Alkalibacillus salilacus TaxID=284582 RepID=A0ABT9VI33_9BACI|nr:YdiK family protein [Alkalibacillus salilacus]MDQ0160629.1 hypothetical protein [Alkalibacillus salilacus]
MKISQTALAWIYVLMGVLFVYLAVETAETTIWNFGTMVFAFIAAVDFGVAIRLFTVKQAMKKSK